jgi:SWI/SNF-related matrix-associated actin-dependent regulator 1 of chromatin subfamily A
LFLATFFAVRHQSPLDLPSHHDILQREGNMILSTEINLDKKEITFYCKSSYEEKDIAKAAGFRWNQSRKRWETKDFAIAKKLSDYVDNNTKKVFERLDKRREENLFASRSKTTEFVPKTPEGLALYPFQKAGVEFILNNANVLLADEMGLGKTPQAIVSINELNPKKTLIVTPASLKLNWQRELGRWLTLKKQIVILDSKSKMQEADIYIINYDILYKLEWLEKISFNLVISDESHYVKNNKAKRSKGFYKLSKKAERKIFLTGTPITNRPSEIYHIIKHLGVKVDWMNYMTRYANAFHNGFSWDVRGASNLEELQEMLRSTVMIRRLKEEVLEELPKKTRQVIPIRLNKSLKKESKFLEELEKNRLVLQQQINQYQEDDNSQQYKLAIAAMKESKMAYFSEMAKIRHQTAVDKIPNCIEHIKDVLENEDKIVIFAHHHDVIDSIVDHFGDIAVKFTGKEDALKKQKAVDEFQNNDNIKLFVGSIQAAGTGITLTKASIAIFLELDWVPANMSQAEDRIHRISQTKPVLIQHLVVDNSLDSRLARTLIRKQEVIEKALDVRKEDLGKEVDLDEILSGKPVETPVEKIPVVFNPVVKNKKFISFSEALVFSNCPHKHYLQYVVKMPFKPSVYTTFGNAVHLCVEEKIKTGKNNWVKMGKSIYKWIQKNPIDDLTEKELDPKEWTRSAFELINMFFDWLDEKFPNGEIIQSEMKLWTPIEGMGNMSFIGYIDLVLKDVTGKYHIMDMKTSNSAWNDKKRSDVEKLYQVILYKKYFCRIKGIDPKDVETHYIIMSRKYNKKNGPIELISKISDKKTLEAANLWLIKQTEGILSSIRIKNKGKCEYCICEDKQSPPELARE